MMPLPFPIAIASPQQGGEPPAFASLFMMVTIFAIFYFVLILPQKNQKRKLEELVKGLKAGDKVIVSPGIFATVVAVEDDALTVRIDEKTRMKVLRSAVAGLQGPPPDTEKK
jgi:preprotein translocase subunit YajC